MALMPQGKSNSRLSRSAPKPGVRRRCARTSCSTAGLVLCGQDLGARERASRPVRLGCCWKRSRHLATLRVLTLNILRRDRIQQVGIRAKQKAAGWSSRYLLHLLNF